MLFSGCRSGYQQEKLPDGVSSHIFPKDPGRRNRWIQAIPRADWIPAKKARVCSLHFEDSDFESSRKDSNPSRHRGELKTRRLKPDAIPRKFLGLPSYLSSARPKERSVEIFFKILWPLCMYRWLAKIATKVSNVTTNKTDRKF